MTPVAALSLSVVLGASLWPFSGRDAEDADRMTIGRMAERTLSVDEEPVEGSAALAMQHYREFLALTEGRPELRAEALRRLADLNLEAGIDAQLAGSGDEAARFAEAVTLYRELLDNYAGQSDTDRVLYQLARAHDGAGDPDSSLATLDRLVLEWPRSVHFDEAQFRRGERLFALGRHGEAESAYASVTALGESSPYYEQGLYKLGWSRFRLGEYHDAQAPFLELLDRRLSAGSAEGVADELDALSRPERELVDDTLRALSIGYSYLEGARTIAATLAGRGPTRHGWLLYQSLGSLYLEQERYRDAAETFDAFVAGDPTHPQAPVMQQAVIEAWTAGGFPTLVLEAKQDYVVRYGLDGPFWQRHARSDVPLVLAQLQQHLGDLAAHDHALAQESGAADDYERAAGWYRRFLAWFPEDPSAAGRSFLLGELMFEAGRFAEATEAYRAAAWGFGFFDQADEAAYAALLAAREHEQRLEGAERAAWQADASRYALRFATGFPEHPEAVPVLAAVAEERFGAGELDRAIEIAGLVVTHQPPATPELERVGWTVIAHAQFDLGRYAQAEQAYLRLRTLPLADAQRNEVDTRIAATIFRQAEQAREAGEVDRAVTNFLRLGEAVPASELRPNAVYDAAALLLVNERWGEAAGLLQQFRAEFPQHALNTEVTRNLAISLAEDRQYSAAAAEYARLADDASVEPAAQRAALWQAADLHASAGNPAGQRQVYERIVARFPQPADEALEARHRLAGLALDAGEPAARQRWLAEIIDADLALGEARTLRSRTLAAHAALELAHPYRDQFAAIRLTLPLDQSLPAKRSRMERALAAYGRAADYGIAEVVTAATYEIAELYFQLSLDLLASERPPGLDPDALEQYEILLEEQVFPFEEQALDLYLANASRTLDGIWDQWVEASFARLSRISPGRYARTERSEHVVNLLD
ncbi:MAG: tetratricopeptide repeat protein [Chromatiales bacterium]|nr:tetratricopeptide repeat protein [Chromatiales bacterium]